MSTTSIYAVTVQWGDCDPAEIVFYPNYFRWFDSAAQTLFDSVGWSYPRLRAELGIVGLPLADVSVRFLRPSRMGQRIDFKTSIESWQERRFVVLHQAYRDDALLLEGRETRVCAQVHPEDPQRIVAASIPAQFKEAFGT
jgi:4-hydroxybenzoyl-CoA thioesterase